MTLTLRTLRSLDGDAVESYVATGPSLTIGRSAGCDWVLPDRGRLLSKRHCAIVRQSAQWLLTDVSSNGMTVNGQTLISGVPCLLGHGDRLGMGAYEMEVLLSSEAAPDSPFAPETHSDPNSFGDRLVGDPFLIVDGRSIISAFDVALPKRFESDDPQHMAGRHDSAGATNAGSDLQAQFTPPRPLSQLLPEDWNTPFEPGPVASKPAALSLEPAAPTAMPDPQASTSALAAQVAQQGCERGFAVLARGAGLEGQPRHPPEIALEQLGRTFRAFVVGLRQVLIARATIKSEFRIDRTMIQPAANNPLKFAADDNDALAAVLGVGRRVDMSAEQAVADALQDIRLHEVAMARATDRAVHELLAELAPDTVLARQPKSLLDLLPGWREMRAWSAYSKVYTRITEGLSDNFDSVLGRSFGRAYQAALAEHEGGASADKQDGGGA